MNIKLLHLKKYTLAFEKNYIFFKLTIYNDSKYIIYFK